MSKKHLHWAAPGDVNAFFGLMLDNIADLFLMVALLAWSFDFPTNFALGHMIPGTAVGVLVGDLLYFAMALRLARISGRNDITAMPLGLDTPSTFGMVFFVLGPAFLAGKVRLAATNPAAGLEEVQLLAATYAWHVGICAIFISGVFKFACAFCADLVRRLVPRAGLLGSLAAIALVLISFLPLVEVLKTPLVGLVALAIVLTTLVAKVRLPGRVPGALGAVLVAGLIYYVMHWTGTLPQIERPAAFDPAAAMLPTGWLTVFRFEWLAAMGDAVQYLPVVIPFALATVVGGIDCTESAAAAGDEYPTGQVIGVEALSTLAAAACGGVIQSTPYIGHPAYKAMGGRSAYVLATALFVGGAGLVGYFGYLYAIIPPAAVYPILVFIGLEITAQSFQVTPKRHYAAIALACVPALAALVLNYLDAVLADLDKMHGLSLADLGPQLQSAVPTLRLMANGFIVTSLLWASALTALTDRNLRRAAGILAVAAVASLFGVIHSPLPGAKLLLPWNVPAATAEPGIRMAAGYLAAAGFLMLWLWWQPRTSKPAPGLHEG